MADRKVIGLAPARLRRLGRRVEALERRLDDLDARADQIEDVLTRLVRVVAVQHRQLMRRFERVDARLARLTRALTQRRVAQLRRVIPIERRPR